jgi:hypothetical protein
MCSIRLLLDTDTLMNFKRIGYVKINERRWEYGWGNCKDALGLCDYEKRRIVISRKGGCDLVDVVSHEALHARFPDLKEEAVNELGTIVGDIYRNLIYSVAPGAKPIKASA